MGTQVAELVAAQHPDQVLALVLLTPVPLGGTNLPDEAIAPFGALGGDWIAQRGVRAQLSPHLSDEQLDRLADVGAPATADVTAHYANVWNDGVTDAPATSAFGGPVLIIRGGADGFVTQQLVDAISARFADPEVNVSRQGRSLGTCRVPRDGRDDDPRLHGCDPRRSAMSGQLQHRVFVTAQIPQSGRGPLPDGSTRMWSPITSTLIMGRRDAALIDPPLTTTQAAEVGDWIAARDANCGIYTSLTVTGIIGSAQFRWRTDSPESRSARPKVRPS
jgi:hypothetical protein